MRKLLVCLSSFFLVLTCFLPLSVSASSADYTQVVDVDNVSFIGNITFDQGFRADEFGFSPLVTSSNDFYDGEILHSFVNWISYSGTFSFAPGKRPIGVDPYTSFNKGASNSPSLNLYIHCPDLMRSGGTLYFSLSNVSSHGDPYFTLASGSVPCVYYSSGGSFVNYDPFNATSRYLGIEGQASAYSYGMKLHKVGSFSGNSGRHKGTYSVTISPTIDDAIDGVIINLNGLVSNRTFVDTFPTTAYVVFDCTSAYYVKLTDDPDYQQIIDSIDNLWELLDSIDSTALLLNQKLGGTNSLLSTTNSHLSNILSQLSNIVSHQLQDTDGNSVASLLSSILDSLNNLSVDSDPEFKSQILQYLSQLDTSLSEASSDLSNLNLIFNNLSVQIDSVSNAFLKVSQAFSNYKNDLDSLNRKQEYYVSLNGVATAILALGTDVLAVKPFSSPLAFISAEFTRFWESLSVPGTLISISAIAVTSLTLSVIFFYIFRRGSK